MDQSDEAFLQEIIDAHGVPDIIVDDGSHIMKHTCAKIQFLYHQVSKNDVYLVEDMHTAYWEKYGGGLKQDV